MSLQNKTALVTGSTSGIGLAIAIELANAGADIIMNGLGDVEAAQKQVADTGAKVMYYAADLTKPNEIEDMMIFVKEKCGSLDILVNNAGIQYVSSIENFPTEKWDEIIALNLSSTFHTTRLALPEMKKKNWGRIINIASAHGLVASANKAAYVAAKHGLVGLTKVIALETAKTGITCNAICPGWVLTSIVKQQIETRAAQNGISFEQATQDLLVEKQPSGQFVTPKQLGQLAVFLCGEGADQILGSALSIDGGWLAQ